MVPKQKEAFDFREFRVIVAEVKGGHIAIGYDKDRKEAARTGLGAADDVKAEIKRLLVPKSEDFVDYPSAITLFRRAFPNGFTDPFFDSYERDYKMKARTAALALLAPDRLRSLIADGKFADVADSARKIFTNLIFPNEAIAYGRFVKRGGPDLESFARTLVELLHGEAGFDAAFDRLAALLKPSGAAKWTILTYWPFLLHPDRHMFMKPTVAVTCARHLGEDFEYESEPSAAVYRRYLAFVETLTSGIAALKPRDNIDVQTFMYAVGKPGFVREAEEERKKTQVETGGNR